MSLPRLDVPTYELNLLSTGTTIKYRPFLVKEEKILLLAIENGETRTITRTIQEIIQACIIDGNIEVSELPMFDLENLFLNIRTKSVGETSDIRVPCISENCEEYTPYTINLEEIKIETNKDHKKTIQLTSDVGLIMKYPSVSTIEDFENLDDTNIEQALTAMISCVETVYDKDTEYDFRDYTQEEKNEFIENLTQQQLNGIQDFFNTMPALQYDLEFKCHACSVEDIIPLRGLQNFFS